ncbi:flagellar filament capping protein FliD [Planosporangium flavigriseum]|nr:flagellar filament capping protein FliD [Planosporangium flavigriseum]NJC66351.1 flagellar filament capping protein FliD [Planosporangium flavigriseum]
MNTSQVIDQLMQLEARPQTMLKAKVSKENLIVAAYQAVNSKMAALKTAAEAFTAPNALTPTNPTWQAVKATSSATSVTATATTGASPVSLTFDVTALAKAQVTTASYASATATATTGSSVDLTVAGTTTTINLTDTSVQGVASAINAAKTGVTAAVVTTTTGTVLQLTGDKTGAANSFSITGLSAATTNIVTASDAQITVGDPASGGYVVTSATNSFTNLMNNVTVNVSKLETGVTMTVAADPESIADKMQALVDAANSALAQVGTYTTYNSTAKSGGVLTGDYTVRLLRDNILSAVSNGLAGYGSYKQVGVDLDKTGKLTFDRSAFIVAYNANPASVQNGVSNGVATSLSKIAKDATDFVSGTLTTAIQSGQDQVKDLNNRIADWDSRLQMRQTALKRQFAAMEAALGQLKNQSSWLAGQIGGLPSGNSSGN